MQPPVDDSMKLIQQHTENSGSDVFVIGMLLAIFAFFVYTVIIPKFTKK